MKGKTILIGGCSYSESNKEPNKPRPFDYSHYDSTTVWYPWTDMLDDEYGDDNNIINVARGSAGQSTIVSLVSKKLFELNFNVDLLLVQWSSPVRVFAEKESDLLESINQQGIDLLSHKGIDIFTDEYYIKLAKIGDDVIFNSLLQIYLFKSLLDLHDINYKFFWGWNQNIDYKKYKFVIDKIYDNKFIMMDKGGSMHEYANSIFGENNTKVLDGHPNTKSHKLFYKDIIREIIKKY